MQTKPRQASLEHRDIDIVKREVRAQLPA
jgi:hypothetical protein